MARESMGGQQQRLQAPVQIKREHPLFKIIKIFTKSQALNHPEAPQSLGHRFIPKKLAWTRVAPGLGQKIAPGAGGRETKAHRIWSNEDLGPPPWQHQRGSSKTSERKVREMQILRIGVSDLADF